jgi:hypothetical protein
LTCVDLKFDRGGIWTMTLDEKVRYGIMALGGASVVLATLGVHVSPLETIGSWGN